MNVRRNERQTLARCTEYTKVIAASRRRGIDVLEDKALERAVEAAADATTNETDPEEAARLAYYSFGGVRKTHIVRPILGRPAPPHTRILSMGKPHKEGMVVQNLRLVNRMLDNDALVVAVRVYGNNEALVEIPPRSVAVVDVKLGQVLSFYSKRDGELQRKVKVVATKPIRVIGKTLKEGKKKIIIIRVFVLKRQYLIFFLFCRRSCPRGNE